VDSVLTPLLELCPATGGDHVWVDDLTEAQLLTGLRPRLDWIIYCDECGASFHAVRGRPEP
jgi:hypothetical protein